MEQTNWSELSKSITHIYYRSNIKSCNYSCYYCPFHKHKSGNVTIEKDKKRLNQFIDYVEAYAKHIKSIMFTPYGEVLVYDHYYKALARLSRLSNIRGIGCQTNASFDIDFMVKQFLEAGGELSKLRLWCTFHPTMVSVKDFIACINKLMEYGIKCSVGAVADVEYLKEIKELRKMLDKSIYIWINKMEGRKRKYTKEEMENFREIDSFFELDLYGKKADYFLCKGGKQSVFVNAAGEVYACNISGKKLFNLYSSCDRKSLDYNLNTQNQCFSNKCDCYISYSLRKDIPKLVNFFPDTAFRIPLTLLLNQHTKAIFFDIDGTLAAKDGRFNSNIDSIFVITWIQNLSIKYKIYVATALPYVTAMKKCSQIKKYLSGGVFARGAYIKDFSINYCEIVPISESVVSSMEELKIFRGYDLRIYKKKEMVYKLSFVPKVFTENLLNQNSIKKHLEKDVLEKIKDKCNIIKEDGVIEVVDSRVSKTEGILKICSKLGIDRKSVAAIGDSVLDYDMMEQFFG